MQKERALSSILLRLWSDTSWQWMEVQLKGDIIPEPWEGGSPTLVRKGKNLWLHTSITKEIPKPPKVQEQVEASDFRVCAIDLNLDGPPGAYSILDSNGTAMRSPGRNYAARTG